ncbi:AIR synthase, partial [Frankia sp. AgKG'84/4]|nr:AIR synthase [Frankia sp. AgKG'84/4]
MELGNVLLGAPALGAARPAWTIEVAAGEADLRAYRRLRHEVFVTEQGLFTGTDRDDADDDERTVVLVARATGGTLLGGVRLHPATAVDLGWWWGGRLAVARAARGGGTGIGPALV